MVRDEVEVSVADEVFLVVAWMHRQMPDREDFTVSEIVRQGELLGIHPVRRPGFQVYVSQHAVANRPPNPGKYRVLVETARGRRRLYRPGDPVDPRRDGKSVPDPAEVPARWRDLVEWVLQGRPKPEASRPFDGLRRLREAGAALWRGVDADGYVREQRAKWD